MPVKRVVIIANGDLEEPSFYKSLLRADDFILCVNGGTGHALNLGLKPGLVIGDLDSLQPADREAIEEINPRQITHPSEKDKSDLELAVDYAVGMKPDEILIIGALGGKRADHEFINLLLLRIPLRHGIKASIVDKNQVIMMADKGIIIEGKEGDYVSLFALTFEGCSLVTKGLKYALKNEILQFGSSRGLSNELTGSQAKISVGSGLLLTVKTSR
jgi:thiamine pyrophosphokinase